MKKRNNFKKKNNFVSVSILILITLFAAILLFRLYGRNEAKNSFYGSSSKTVQTSSSHTNTKKIPEKSALPTDNPSNSRAVNGNNSVDGQSSETVEVGESNAGSPEAA